jgi:MFS family permease
MWSSSFYLGLFLGPTVSGFLVDAYGFEWTAVIFSALYCIAIVINTCELAYTFFIQKDKFLIDPNENIVPA